MAKIQKEGSSLLIMATEKCDGDLAQLLQMPLTETQKRSIMIQLLEGYADLHQLGYVHRDVKAENIFYIMDTEGNITIKIADLGLSCPAEWKEEYQFAGSPLFYSPELGKVLTNQLKPREVDFTKSDIWGLGLICYRLYKGEHPKYVEAGIKFSPEYVKWVKLIAQLTNISGLNKEDPIESLIASMLDCDFNTRPSAAEALEMLSLHEQKPLHNSEKDEGLDSSENEQEDSLPGSPKDSFI